MAATYYVSITSDCSLLSKDVDNVGTSSTSTDILELRVGNGTYAPDRAEVLKGLERLIRFYAQGGLKGAGTNIPLPTGPN